MRPLERVVKAILAADASGEQHSATFAVTNGPQPFTAEFTTMNWTEMEAFAASVAEATGVSVVVLRREAPEQSEPYPHSKKGCAIFCSKTELVMLPKGRIKCRDIDPRTGFPETYFVDATDLLPALHTAH